MIERAGGSEISLRGLSLFFVGTADALIMAITFGGLQ